MSQGTLYVSERIRGALPAALVKHFKLDIKVTAPPANYKEKFPLGKIPAYEGEKGFKLTEAIAVCIYRKCNTMMRNITNNSYPCLNI